MNAAVYAEWSAAKAAGVSRYDSTIPCRHGHIGKRFTLDRKCCICNAIKCKQRHDKRVGAAGLIARSKRASRALLRREESAARSRDYAARSALRQEAIASGAATYKATTSCPKGHLSDRYTGNGMCVDCAKEKSKIRGEDGYYKSHYAKNLIQILAKQREYHRRAGGRSVAQAKVWAARNPQKRKAISKQYKSRRRSQEECGITGGMLAMWIRDQQKICFYCRSDCTETFHVDHFLPLSKGGAHVLTNLRIACPSCNLHKHAKTPDVWIEEVGDSYAIAA